MHTLIRPMIVPLMVVLVGLVLVMPVAAQCTVENAGNSDVVRTNCEYTGQAIPDPGSNNPDDTVYGDATYSAMWNGDQGVARKDIEGETDDGLQASQLYLQSYNVNSGQYVNVQHITREDDDGSGRRVCNVVIRNESQDSSWHIIRARGGNACP